MTTALTIVTGAARLLGVVRKGEALDADEAQDALNALNDMIDAWSNNSLMIRSRVMESLPLPTSAQSYAIGTGATLDTEKPLHIIDASIKVGDLEYPLTKLNDEEYNNIGIKTTGGGPGGWYYYEDSYPNGVIHIYPVQTAGVTLRLLSEKSLTTYDTLATSVDLPKGFAKALRYNLALELAPEYDKTPSQLVLKGAQDGLRAIELATAKNRPMPYMHDSRGVSTNIFTGEYV